MATSRLIPQASSAAKSRTQNGSVMVETNQATWTGRTRRQAIAALAAIRRAQPSTSIERSLGSGVATIPTQTAMPTKSAANNASATNGRCVTMWTGLRKTSITPR